MPRASCHAQLAGEQSLRSAACGVEFAKQDDDFFMWEELFYTASKVCKVGHIDGNSVTNGVFEKGHMDMDQCLKLGLAATCGCDKAPGLDTIDKLFKAIKENDAAAPGEKDFTHKTHAVADTHQSAKFRPAKIEECAKGMIGKKVAEDLYIDISEGIGGEYEICTPKFMEKVLPRVLDFLDVQTNVEEEGANWPMFTKLKLQVQLEMGQLGQAASDSTVMTVMEEK